MTENSFIEPTTTQHCEWLQRHTQFLGALSGATIRENHSFPNIESGASPYPNVGEFLHLIVHRAESRVEAARQINS